MVTIYPKSVQSDETTVTDLATAASALLNNCLERTPSLEGTVTQLG